jgi:hypothetical protein
VVPELVEGNGRRGPLEKEGAGDEGLPALNLLPWTRENKYFHSREKKHQRRLLWPFQ